MCESSVLLSYKSPQHCGCKWHVRPPGTAEVALVPAAQPAQRGKHFLCVTLEVLLLVLHYQDQRDRQRKVSNPACLKQDITGLESSSLPGELRTPHNAGCSIAGVCNPNSCSGR